MITLTISIPIVKCARICCDFWIKLCLLIKWNIVCRILHELQAGSTVSALTESFSSKLLMFSLQVTTIYILWWIYCSAWTDSTSASFIFYNGGRRARKTGGAVLKLEDYPFNYRSELVNSWLNSFLENQNYKRHADGRQKTKAHTFILDEDISAYCKQHRLNKLTLMYDPISFRITKDHWNKNYCKERKPGHISKHIVFLTRNSPQSSGRRDFTMPSNMGGDGSPPNMFEE